MKRDFSLYTYRTLLNAVLQSNYLVIPLEKYFRNQKKLNKLIILRHDIDKRPHNSLIIAKIEKELNIKSSYYFRVNNRIFDEIIIKRIANLGHEIGYHYEDLALAKGDFNSAKDLFERNLNKLRKFYPVKTICMHGSPLSKYDNRDLWKKYDYRDFGIIGEPYFDVDFNEVLYLTDTGRAWNTSGGNVRDKAKSKYNYNFKSTFDIIEALGNDELPDKIMLNIHPQRWSNNKLFWIKELIYQNLKNVIKTIIVLNSNKSF